MKFIIFIICYLLLPNVHSSLTTASSYIKIWSTGTTFQPANSIELLSTLTIQSFSNCAIACNLNDQCRTFVYDSVSKQCNLYEGEISTGTVLQSNSTTSQIGSIYYFADLYNCYNKTNDQCPFDRYLVADNSTNVGVCPKDTYWNGTICLNQLYIGQSCSFDQMCRTDLGIGCDLITNQTCYEVYDINLIKNGDAETGPCQPGYNITSPTLWSFYGSVTQSLYTNPYATLSPVTVGPSNRGNCYFSGFFDAYTYMYQTISLNHYSVAIDQNQVSYNFSAWVGGWYNQDDTATLWITFFDSNDVIRGNITIPPVHNYDRLNVTGLFYRQMTGIVPVNARYFQIFVAMTAVTPWNDGSVDNISFELQKTP